jgi:Tol biopolymer transport system component
MYVSGTSEVQGVYLGSLGSGDVKRLTAADAGAAYLDPGRIAFVRDNALVAYSIDVAKGELTGDPVTVADGVGRNAGFTQGAFSIAGSLIAYRTGDANRRQLRWYDRSGKTVGAVAEPDATLFLNPELSPDGQRLAIQRVMQSNPDIWIKDLVRGSFVRFTFDLSNDNYPVWSPDGQRIVFRSDRKGSYLYVKASSGAGSETLLLDGAGIKVPQDWSPDERFILYYEADPKTARDLWVFDTKENKARVFLNTPFEKTIAQFSPDGRFVAYQTNESGNVEVVVQPFPEPTTKWQVSTNGGMQPRWRADGKELYFISTDNKLMAVPVTPKGSTLEVGTPTPLFTTRILTGGIGTINRPQYAVSRDGRFLINETVEDSAVSPITLILNWHPERGK